MSAGNHRQSGESRVVAVIMVLAFVLAVVNIAMFADGVLSALSTTPSDTVNANVLATTALPVVADGTTPTSTRQPPAILPTATAPPPTLVPLPTIEPVQPTATVFMLPTMIPATALPVDTPLPTVDPNVQSSAIYAGEIVEVMQLYQSAFDTLGPLFEQATNNPAVFFDDGWKTQVALQLAVVQLAGESARSIVPPAHLRVVQEQILLSAFHCDNSFNLYAEGIDNLDPQKIMQGSQELTAAASALNEANRLMRDIIAS